MLSILGILFIIVFVYWLVITLPKGIRRAKLESQIPKTMIVNGHDITKVPDWEYEEFINSMNKVRNTHKLLNKIHIKDEMKRLNDENEKEFPS